MIVEMNPRLTTSYVGYRQLYSRILPASFWLTPSCRVAAGEVTGAEWNRDSSFIDS